MIKWNVYLPKQSESTKSAHVYFEDMGNAQIVVVLSLLGSDPFNAYSASGMLWEKIKEALFEQNEGETIVQRIEKALRRSRQQLLSLIRNDPNFADLGIDMHLSILHVETIIDQPEKSVISIGNIGDNDIFIVREKPIDLSELIHQKNEIFQTGSGILEPNDIILTSSPNTADAYFGTHFEEGIDSHAQWKKITEEIESLSEDFVSTQIVLTGMVQGGEEQVPDNIPTSESTTSTIPTSNSNDSQTPVVAGTVPASPQLYDPNKRITGNVKVDQVLNGIRRLWFNASEKTKPALNIAKAKAIELYNRAKVLASETINKVKNRGKSIGTVTSQAPGAHTPLTSTDLTTSLPERVTEGTYKYNEPTVGSIGSGETATIPGAGGIPRGYIRNPTLRKILGLLSFLPIQPKNAPSHLRTNVALPFYKQRNIQIISIVVVVAIVGTVLFLNIDKNNKYNKLVNTTKTNISDITSEVTTIESSVNAGSFASEEVVTKLTQILGNLSQVSLDGLKDNDKAPLETELNSAKTRLLAIYNKVYDITPVIEGQNLERLVDTVMSCENETDPIDFAISDPYIAIVGQGNRSVCVWNMDSPGSSGFIIDKGRQTIEKPIAITSYAGGFYVLDEKNGVIEVKTKNSEEVVVNPSLFEIKTIPALTAASTGPSTEIETYGEEFEENLYFLVPSESRVKKSLNSDGTFGYPIDYTAPDEQLTYSVDLMIDGYIYIATNARNIDPAYSSFVKKYSGGTPQSIKLNSVAPSPQRVIKGATNYGDLKPMYLAIESSANPIISQGSIQKLLIIEKPYAIQGDDGSVSVAHEGELVLLEQLEYQGSDVTLFKDVTEIFVDLEDKNLYVLDGTKILRISLE